MCTPCMSLQWKSVKTFPGLFAETQRVVTLHSVHIYHSLFSLKTLPDSVANF